jgi:hypothetical protein
MYGSHGLGGGRGMVGWPGGSFCSPIGSSLQQGAHGSMLGGQHMHMAWFGYCAQHLWMVDYRPCDCGGVASQRHGGS